ncbi:hypothetical protein GGR55DRAFT_657758 [Xylaria sp. FL0064]|nr:hypothetical protein GGR55DRAFT_657758 [Xylaria sp. FL0064]
MTNLGPLTTTFTPQGPDCASTFLGRVSDNVWVQYGVGASPSSACYPSSFIPYEPYYYSPGICPSGYTAACTAQISVSSDVSAKQLTCCPTSYTCRDARSDDPFACISPFSGKRTFAVSTFFFQTDTEGSTTKIVAGTTTAVWADNYLFAYGPLVIPTTREVVSATMLRTLYMSLRVYMMFAGVLDLQVIIRLTAGGP